MAMIKWLVVGLLLVLGTTLTNADQSVELDFDHMPLLDCEKLGDGNYVYGCNNTFWMCVYGKLHVQNCLPQLKFDPETNVCEYAKNIDLCKNHYDNLPATIPTKANDESFSCNGKPTGIYAKSKCSPIHIYCVHDTHLFETACPFDLIYDQENQICEFPHNVEGCKKNEIFDLDKIHAKTTENLCEEKPDGNYGISKCGRDFVYCSDRVEVIRDHCAIVFIFDEENQVCEYPENVKACRQNETILHQQTTTTTLTDADQSNVDQEKINPNLNDSLAPTIPPKIEDSFSCKEKPPGVYAKSICGNAFVFCIEDGTEITQFCPSDLYYDEENEFCELKKFVKACQKNETLDQQTTTTTVLPNLQQQNDPILTEIDTPIQSQKRQSELEFEIQKQEKVSAAAKSLNVFDCSNLEDGIYPSSLNACESFFWRCESGKAKKYLCPIGLYFGIQNATCDLRQNIQECNGRVQQYPNHTIIFSNVTTSQQQSNGPLPHLPFNQSAATIINLFITIGKDSPKNSAIHVFGP